MSLEPSLKAPQFPLGQNIAKKSINFPPRQIWVTFYSFYGRENGDEETFSFVFNQKQKKI